MSLDPLVSTNDLANYLQQNLTDYETEARYSVELASAAVRAYCRRSLSFIEDDVRTFRWRPAIVLPDAPVVSILDVAVGDLSVDWYRDRRGSVVCDSDPVALLGGLNYPYPDVTVTYSHGFIEMPAAISMITVRIAARTFKNPLQRTSYSADNLNYSTGPDVAPRILTADEQMILKPYRMMRFTS